MAIINRKELYKKIWETPFTRLSKEYGLSDVGFAKICKKHNIPRPPGVIRTPSIRSLISQYTARDYELLENLV